MDPYGTSQSKFSEAWLSLTSAPSWAYRPDRGISIRMSTSSFLILGAFFFVARGVIFEDKQASAYNGSFVLCPPWRTGGV